MIAASQPTRVEPHRLLAWRPRGPGHSGRLNQRKEESVDKEIEHRKGNDDGLECLADAFTRLRADSAHVRT
jgi:hypothetical protein